MIPSMIKRGSVGGQHATGAWYTFRGFAWIGMIIACAWLMTHNAMFGLLVIGGLVSLEEKDFSHMLAWIGDNEEVAM